MSEPYWIPVGGAPAGVQKLFDQTLAAAAPSFDIQNIPQTFAMLKLITMLRSDQAVATANGVLRFNNDAGGNYADQQIYANAATTVAAFEVNGSAGLTQCLTQAGASALAGWFPMTEITIPNYTSTVANKTVLAHRAVIVGIATGQHFPSFAVGGWASLAAINRVAVYPAAGNFVAGSRCILYGVV